ncbi:hypothetical protein [Streptomyces sp. HB2AG]|uniref:hypothetical protein n=1 Tax=Streptomyces sp. HB2AG TaxID=2983400 RepID=UPI0022AA3907|nr:hypothetical protein [Streptomyces sp. HB2AG]MCZ2523856.1 hypothetical protein [Streptomyces sp. HB2AG]
MIALFPYQTLIGDIGFEVESVSLDGLPLPRHMLSVADRRVALNRADRREWREARLDLRAALPEAELEEGPWTDVVCLAVLTEGATNTRTVGRLRRKPDGWRGALTFARSSHRRRAVLSLHVVATVEDVPGRTIGQGDGTWTVDLVADTPVEQRELNVEEIDFRDGPHEWLRPFKDAPWLVDTAGEMPTVLLNTGFEGLAQFLDSGGGSAEKALRGVLAAQIATDAWGAMFQAAVADLEQDEDGTPHWPTGWKESALRTMLPDVLPDLSVTDALAEVHARLSKPGGLQDLLPRIQYAAGRKARVAKNIGTALRYLERSEGDK